MRDSAGLLDASCGPAAGDPYSAPPVERPFLEEVGADPGRLPEHVRARFRVDGEQRAIADYVAGMTDRFALDEHRRLGGAA